jgi:hypothetical protein
VAQLDPEQCGLQRVEPEIAPDNFMVVFGFAAMGAKETGALSQGIIVGDEEAAAAKSP